MPLSLAERVRERRNQRIAASQQRRLANEKTNDLPTMAPISGNSHGALVPVLQMGETASAPQTQSHFQITPYGAASSISPDGKQSYRSRNMVSPVNLPGKPPASPKNQAASSPTSPRPLHFANSSSSPSSSRNQTSSGSRARNLYNSIPSSNLGNRSHPVVTPHAMPDLSGGGWEENEVPSFRLALRSDRSVSSEVLPRFSNYPPLHASSFSRGEARSVHSESHLLEDGHMPRTRRNKEIVPMDERSADLESRRSMDEDDALLMRHPRRPKLPTSVRLVEHHSNALLPPAADPVGRRTGGVQDDDVSSLGGIEDQLSTTSRTSLARLTAAVRSNTPRGLVAEERALWETFQASLATSRRAALDEADPKLREKLKEQQSEQDRSIRAIQRVLADVSEDRDQANSKAKERQQEKRQLQRTVDSLTDQVRLLEQESQRRVREEAKNTASILTSEPNAEMEELKEKIADLVEEKEKLSLEIDSKNKQVTKLKRHLHGKGDVVIEDSGGLKKELKERTAALENAKMIIASLENASGSLASDTRFRLKAKDSEILSIKTDARHQQKKLDNLATQLKEIQRVKAQISEERAHDMARISVWKSALQEHLTEMQSASVILEATRNSPAAMDRFSQVVIESLETMQKTVDVLDHEHEDDDENKGAPFSGTYHGNDMDSLASGTSAGSRMREVKQELEKKNSTVRRLDEELRKIKEEAHSMRAEAERVEQQRETDNKTLYGEIQMLRIQCNTNMELLSKKERELAVLRDSLKVEDDDVGYISDDASDIDDEEEDAVTSTANHSLATLKYTPSQAEAIASLLAHGRGSHIETMIPSGQASDMDKVRLELSESRLSAEKSQKELKTEKESLANAKMIISSLEKANKSMMEDLRSRLQESNSAIASLLEKSAESEKKTRTLELELEAFRNEKEDLMRSKEDVSSFLKEEKKEEFTETIN